jgi:hypothetical protein
VHQNIWNGTITIGGRCGSLRKAAEYDDTKKRARNIYFAGYETYTRIPYILQVDRRTSHNTSTSLPSYCAPSHTTAVPFNNTTLLPQTSSPKPPILEIRPPTRVKPRPHSSIPRSVRHIDPTSTRAARIARGGAARSGHSAHAPVIIWEVALRRLIVGSGGRGDAVGVPVGVVLRALGVSWFHFCRLFYGVSLGLSCGHQDWLSDMGYLRSWCFV